MARESTSGTIGPYHILGPLGEGGMGEVFKAERREPIRQLVALKVIKRGLATKEVLARFELERRALAAMQHRSIATVLDAGSTERGEPYFVMELVEGLPLTDFCDKHRLSLKERLRLFQQVCHAVQHAHQKGVVHRDLKPANILVVREGSEPVPKVLDFGVAKATNRDFLTATLVTEQDRILGTPEYMAPEQAAGDGEVLDVRADVYSLGVILYELLTGSLPFPTDELRRAGALETLRIIREDDPPKPSTRLATERDLARDVASRRSTRVDRLARELKGDLDWVILRAMAKEPARRYEAAITLAADVDRYLAHEPVTAGPPSFTYRLRKLLRRHRAQVAGAAAVFLTAVVGAFVALDYAAEANAQAVLAKNNEKEASGQRDLAKARAERLAAQAEELEQVVAFQDSVLRKVDPRSLGNRIQSLLLESVEAAALRSGASPESAAQRIAQLTEIIRGVNFTNLGRETMDLGVLAPAVAAAESAFAETPLIRARLLQAIATTLTTFGLLQQASHPQGEALRIRRDLLGPDAVDTLVSQNNMASLLEALGKHDEATTLCDHVLDRMRAVLGPDHEYTLSTLTMRGILHHHAGELERAEACYRKVLVAEQRVHGKDHPTLTVSLSNLATVLGERGELEDAEQTFLRAISISQREFGGPGKAHPTLYGNLARTQARMKRWKDAERNYSRAVEGFRHYGGDEHHQTVVSMHNLGVFLKNRGRDEEAVAILATAIANAERSTGVAPVDVAACKFLLAELYRKQGLTMDALALCRAAVVTYQSERPVTDAERVRATGLLVDLLEETGDSPAEESALRELFSATKTAHGEDHKTTWTVRNNLGQFLWRKGEHAAASELFQVCLKQALAAHGSDHLDTALSHKNLAIQYQAMRTFAAAQDHYEKALASYRALVAPDAPEVQEILNSLGYIHWSQRRFDDAEPYFRDALALRRTARGNLHPLTLTSVNNMGCLRRDTSRWKDAEALFREAWRGRAKALGAEDPNTLASVFELGSMLYRRGTKARQEGQLGLAQTKLEESFELLRKLGGKRGSDTARAVAMELATVYGIWHGRDPDAGHDAKAEEWRARAEGFD